MSGIRLDEHVSLKFMLWYTQKPTLSCWSDQNRTMSYLYPSWQKKGKLAEHNSCNYFIPFGLVSRRCHYFDLLPSPLICEHFVMMTCNTILCTLQSNDKFAGIHSSLHNCVKTDPKFWLMDEGSWNKTEIFPSSSVFLWYHMSYSLKRLKKILHMLQIYIL